jgi:hypothetical protein
LKEDANKKAEETRKRIADIKKNPGDWVPIGPPLLRPALGKKYNVEGFEVKKQNYSISRFCRSPCVAHEQKNRT